MLVEFCLPVKDEEAILEANAKRLGDFLMKIKPEYEWRIVTIVNGSKDRSAEIASQLVSEKNYFISVTFPEGGKGHALREYFWQSRADILVFMDIDLAVSLEAIPSLVAPVSQGVADLVIGSRLLPTSHTDRSFMRSLTSRCYNLLSRLVLGHHFTDLQCGFKAIRRTAFDQLFPNLQDNGWFFDTELVILGYRQNQVVSEIPVDWQENRYDTRQSKVRVIRDAWSFVINLIRLRRQLKGRGRVASLGR